MLRTLYCPKGCTVKFSYREMSLLLVDAVSQAVDTVQDFVSDYQFFRVWTANSVEEAWKILADQEKSITLVITAWKMQPQSGFQLVEKIRNDARLKETPVLMMRDKRDKHVDEKGEELGITGYIPLPLVSKSTLAEIDKILEPLVDETEEEFLKHAHEARIAVRKEKWDKAEKHYKAALAAKNDEECHLGLGKILKAKNDFAGAEKCFMSAMRMNPKNLKGYVGLADSYIAAGRLEDALKVLALAVTMSKKIKASGNTQASLFFYMGEVALRLKRLKESLGYFRKVGELNTTDAELQVKIGDTLSEDDRLEEAEEFYQLALKMNPGLAHVYNRLGMAYRRQKKFTEALNLYNRALTFHPDDENLQYNIARVYWEMEDFQPAAETLSKALKLNPEFNEARQLLDAVLKKLGYEMNEEGKIVPPASAEN
jgi:tetratricopeptide (TPR) repeat protein